MLWYKDLYMGETAERKRPSIIQMIRAEKPSPCAYVILPAANEANLLDIVQASQICGDRGELWRRLHGRELLILGIAWGYEEALRLAGRMVDEVYHATGGFDLKTYLGLDGYVKAVPETDHAAEDAEVVG